MFIYILLLIPIAISIYAYLKHKDEMVWWEYLLIYGVAIASIFISKAVVQHIQVTDTEYWGGWVTEVRYYEEWDEYIHQTCTCCCDKDGNNCMTYDCSYVDTHYPYWELHGSNGEVVNISESRYKQLVSKFGTPKKFVDMHRSYHSIDGDMYKCDWGGTDSSLEPVVSRHSYENRVRVSSSTYALQEPPKEIFDDYGLFHYPEINEGYKQQIILGYNDTYAERAFQLLNAKLGRRMQFKSYVMIFKDQPRDAGLYQEEQWQGGNKNELNIAIGIDGSGKVKWCHIFSWTDKRDIVVNTKTFVEEQDQLDLISLADFLAKEVPQKWVRKPFSEFSYLTVEPKGIHIFISFIITLAINIGVLIFLISNDHNNRSSSRGYYRY